VQEQNREIKVKAAEKESELKERILRNQTDAAFSLMNALLYGTAQGRSHPTYPMITV
jgi:hypothetical protein